jgi:hypothetical protein
VELFGGSRDESDGLESIISALFGVAIAITVLCFPFMFFIASHPYISLYKDLLKFINATFPLQVSEMVWSLLFSTTYTAVILICWLNILFVLHMMLTYVKSCSGWMASLHKAW